MKAYLALSHLILLRLALVSLYHMCAILSVLVFLTVCVFVCSGTRAAGAAVGRGVCSNRSPDQSPEAAAAEHRPATTHFAAGQTDPRTGAQSCRPVNI